MTNQSDSKKTQSSSLKKEALSSNQSPQPQAEITDIPLARINLDGGTQIRQKLNAETIENYREAMQEGTQFPPIEAYREPDQEAYWLADGFHRVQAALQEGWKTFPAFVKPGGYRDALLAAVGANATHGLPRNNADKRRAAITLLGDEEWSRWADREIARHCSVSHTFVAQLRADLSGNGLQIPTKRMVQRGGTVYTQQTARIGKSGSTVTNQPNEVKNSFQLLLEPLRQLSEADLREFVSELQKLLPHLLRQPVVTKPVIKPPAANLAGWLKANYTTEELKKALSQMEDSPQLPSLEEEVRRRKRKM